MTIALILASLVLLVLFGVLTWHALNDFSYLGGAGVRHSYSWGARCYDGKWRSPSYQNAAQTRQLLAPLLEQAGGDPAAVVVDLACGTGRFTRLMLAEEEFRGKIIAVDFAPGMLRELRRVLQEMPPAAQSRVEIQEQDVRQWRPAAESLQAVALLEAAEIIHPLGPTLEAIFVGLQPGGLLLTTVVGNGFGWLFPGRRQARAEFSDWLAEIGFVEIQRHPWRRRYDWLLARKPLPPARSHPP
ncbi:class I SAM-dependent methyltransferase [Lignipirellula cremea]|uniref:Ubiquinone/menaquinone biosynthesis methyltransferase n=1 Tax=Lignipirellula cremea TaxID=2528010 RepID=A0A518E1W0_9BACT|nr:class I SAM-dependent methyltransferase [Lignipirellula cremea]QDU98076.1 ubiquinone/menaquinone biosynthesis methyltransferase [Lignipirellula cremea]